MRRWKVAGAPNKPNGSVTNRSSSCAWTKSRKRSSCSSFMSISAWWRPASDLTSSASGVDWASCMAACRLPRPGFRHQCKRVRGSREGRRGSQGWRAKQRGSLFQPVQLHKIKINNSVSGSSPQCLLSPLASARKHSLLSAGLRGLFLVSPTITGIRYRCYSSFTCQPFHRSSQNPLSP